MKAGGAAKEEEIRAFSHSLPSASRMSSASLLSAGCSSLSAILCSGLRASYRVEMCGQGDCRKASWKPVVKCGLRVGTWTGAPCTTGTAAPHLWLPYQQLSIRTPAQKFGRTGGLRLAGMRVGLSFSKFPFFSIAQLQTALFETLLRKCLALCRRHPRTGRLIFSTR